MPIDPRGAELVRLIATGSTLKKAAETLNLSTSRTNQVLARACRALGMSSVIAVIRANPEDYLSRLPAPQEIPEEVLRPALQRQLISGLKLVDSEFTPSKISNYSATQLRSIGLTDVAIAETQQWLRKRGLYLKQYSSLTKSEMRSLEQALFLLDAYHFDVLSARQQLDDEQTAAG